MNKKAIALKNCSFNEREYILDRVCIFDDRYATDLRGYQRGLTSKAFQIEWAAAVRGTPNLRNVRAHRPQRDHVHVVACSDELALLVGCGDLVATYPSTFFDISVALERGQSTRGP